MSDINIEKALLDIGLALCASHNTIATDKVDIEPGQHAWRINHQPELDQLKLLEDALLNNTHTCPLCGHRNNGL